jgi:peptide/nickel transport system permease protein
MFVLLWTDALLFLLLGIALTFATYARRREPLREPWRRVVRSRIGMVAAVILAVFVLIGLLDSLHFRQRLAAADRHGEARYSAEIISLLDVLLGPLREHQEKTYSAPFATHLHSQETIERADGQRVRDYPRLNYGGSHLADPRADKGADILQRGARGGMLGWLIWLGMTFGLILWLAHRRGGAPALMAQRVMRGETEVPWRAMLVALAILGVTGGAIANLATAYHLLGTDKIGEDVFYQALKGVRTGLMIGTLTTLVMLPAALLLGILAGYFRGWVDDVIQYLYTTLNSIPGVLLIAAAILMLDVYMGSRPEEFTSLTQRADLRLLFLCLILGVTSWTSLCRLLRGEVLKLREMDYVVVAQALGVSHTRIITRHLFPNVLHLVLITLVLDFSGLVLAEAVLAYVNIGVDPSMHSWGNMINGARLELVREPMVWWSLAAAFGFMMVLVLAANLFADVVRDAFDPRLGREG